MTGIHEKKNPVSSMMPKQLYEWWSISALQVLVSTTPRYSRQVLSSSPHPTTKKKVALVMLEEAKNQIKDRVSFLADNQLLGGITPRRINQWLGNPYSNSDTPYVLLNALVIINEKQLVACVEDLTNQIKAQFYCQNPELEEDELIKQFNIYLDETAFVCATKSGDAASSAGRVGRIIRNFLGCRYHEYRFQELCQAIDSQKVKRVYIVDDFIGTGRQMLKFLSQEIQREFCSASNGYHNCNLKCIMDRYPNIPFVVLSIIMCKNGYRKITKKFSNMQFINCYTLSHDHNLLSSQCYAYTALELQKNQINAVIDDIRLILTKHKMGSLYSLHLFCGFYDSFPNNALELFWWNSSSSWVPLLSRPQDRSPII